MAAADKKAVGLSRALVYESKCIGPTVLTRYVNILILIEYTQSADNLVHSFRYYVRMNTF